MADNFVIEMIKGKKFVAPSKEALLEKIAGLEEDISGYEKQNMPQSQKDIIEICKSYIQSAKECMKSFLSHPHLIWNLLHRVDEHIILLVSPDELYVRAMNVRTAFDLTVTEKKVRENVLGEKGALTIAIKDINEGKNIEKSKFLVKDALQYLNENVDTNYWILSMNTLMSVCSGALLGAFMVIFYLFYYQDLDVLSENPNLAPFAILGLMGGYLSNLITKENFLFVRGGPFWRYLVHNLMSRAIIGAFSATFIFLLAQSKWVFSINPVIEGSKGQPMPSTVLSINVDENVLVYVYIVIAIAAGFAGEKLLRNMIDGVLKRLEEKAAKTKETKAETTKTKETT
jgi:hypothetical protein